MAPEDTKKQHAKRDVAQKTGGTVPGAKPEVNIVHVLETHRKGKTIVDAQVTLQELVAAVRDTKRKGTMTLTIGVECRTVGVGKVLDVDMKIKANLPEPVREKTIYFSTPKGTLQRDDPLQGTLDGVLDD